MKPEESEASPMKAVVEELESLRLLVREVLALYLTKLEGDIDALQNAVQYVVSTQKIDSSKLRDIREMLTVLRHAPAKPGKPGKARRKDLKKVENVISDLQILTEHWR